MKINSNGSRHKKQWFAVECREKPVQGHPQKGQKRGDGIPHKSKKGAGIMQEITENGVNGNISQKIQDGLAVDLAAQEEGSWMPVEENKEQSEEGGTFASEEIAALEKENASLSLIHI